MLSKLPNYMVNLRYFSITGILPYKRINVAAFGKLKSLRSFELKCRYYKEWFGKEEKRTLHYYDSPPIDDEPGSPAHSEYEWVHVLDNVGVRGVYEVTRVLHIMRRIILIFWSAYQSSCEI